MCCQRGFGNFSEAVTIASLMAMMQMKEDSEKVVRKKENIEREDRRMSSVEDSSLKRQCLQSWPRKLELANGRERRCRRQVPLGERSQSD